jgi:hypothetical protein
MADMRDRLIHDYFGVDYGIVWDVATTKMPPLPTPGDLTAGNHGLTAPLLFSPYRGRYRGVVHLNCWVDASQQSKLKTVTGERRAASRAPVARADAEILPEWVTGRASSDLGRLRFGRLAFQRGTEGTLGLAFHFDAIELLMLHKITSIGD